MFLSAETILDPSRNPRLSICEQFGEKELNLSLSNSLLSFPF